MSVSTVQSLFKYAIGSLGQAFTPNCPIQNLSDFVVTYTSVGFADTVLTLNVDYFVTGTSTLGVIGSPVVTLEPVGLHYAVGGSVTIQRLPPFTQPTVYVDGVKYLAAVPNNSLDWLTYSIQALNDKVARCLQVPATSAVLTPLTYAARSNGGLGSLLGFDASGNPALYLPGTIGGVVSTGQFYANSGARIARINDRLFVGGSTLSDGNNPEVTTDWVSTFYNANGYTAWQTAGTFNATTGTNSHDNNAIFCATRSLNNISAGASSIALMATAINNNATLATNVWAIYAEAQTTHAGVGSSYVMELSSRSLFATINPTPYALGSQVGVQLSSGCGVASAGQFDNSAAIQIVANPMKWQKGLVFGSTSLTGSDGVTGLATAIALGRGHTLQWFSAGGVSGPAIYSVTDAGASSGTNIAFSNGGMAVTDYQGGNIANFQASATLLKNYFNFAGGINASNAITLSALGTDTNIDLVLTPKGTGQVNIGGAQLKSTLATGTAPFVVASTTQVANLSSTYLAGFNWQTPDQIGASVPNTAVFTTLTANGVVTFTPVASASTRSYVVINTPADTAQTAATESQGIKTVTGTRTWAIGTTAVQREVFLAGPTYAGAGATATFTDAFTLGITPPVVGANAAITRNHSVGILDATSAASSITGGLIVATAFGTTATSVGIGGGNVNAGGTIIAGTGLTVTSGATSLKQTTIAGAAATTALTITQTARTSGVLPYITWTIPTDTSLTASTAAPGLLVVTGTRQWAVGTVASQSENLFVAPTYAGAGATATFTKAATLSITGAPIVGANAAITNSYALWVQAGLAQFDGGLVGTNILSNGSASKVGYQTGVGGGNAVAQASSRTTGVTINKVTGQITLVSAAGSAAYQTFTVSNTTVAAGDTVQVIQKSGTDKYIILVTNINAGVGFDITFATTGGTTVETPVFSFTTLSGSSN